MTDNGTLRDHLADVISERNELLRKVEVLQQMAHNLYEETKRCGTTHDTQATWDYGQWLEDND